MNGGAIVQPVSSIGRKVVEERVGVLNLGQVCDRWTPIIATAKVRVGSRAALLDQLRIL